ncbi:WD40 repeat-like protein [Periconia macrospinosa]|uniref:WD40 repeat-like protein n=1 Tax=Periconia macrospinosa TaxID=97972 RepID=A0A2V1D156_9PLEO|nr:WD40 repeat-like protein [Periconia macrospinosa]
MAVNIYNTGPVGQPGRFGDLTSKEEECLRDLFITDPCHDKIRIEEIKGGLQEDCYRWVLEHDGFLQWRDGEHSRLLWIKGDPGKGKTMLLCGIINELNKSIAKRHLLSYFFCEATDSRINNATAVLRGLIYRLVVQQPSLLSHIREKYDHRGKTLFEGTNAWAALFEIFTNILQDPSLSSTYLIIDALDECEVDLPKLLNFIVQKSTISSRVKWVVSSRNDANIERRLQVDDSGMRLSLELKENAEQVSRAVGLYIDDKLSRLESLNNSLRNQVRDILRRKADGTFLWVALVVRELEGPGSWDPLQVAEEAPPGLHQLYDRMMNQIQRLKEKNSEMCRLLLSTACVAYRPLYLAEMGSLCGLSGQVSTLVRNVRTIVVMCSSFLTVRGDQVYFIHQSAKDYLSDKMRNTVFPSERRIHYDMFSRSLKLMSSALKRDMYSLIAPGFPVDKVQVPVHDPLATMRYSCVHWVDHLCDWDSNSANHGIDSQEKGAIVDFIKKKYLYWLEALSLCRSVSEGVLAMAKLNALAQRRADAPSFIKLLQDARLFIMYHIQAIQNSPLQVYGCALIFSPDRSLIRSYFKEEEPKGISIKPAIGDQWSACLQTLEGHRDSVRSVAFSHDSARLASVSVDRTVKIWDVGSGECLKTLEGHRDSVNSVAFSHDSARLASASNDRTVKNWDAGSGKCLQTLEGHRDWVRSVAFSHDSARLASASDDSTVKIWDAGRGECLQTLEGHSSWVWSVAFSHDSAQLASASVDNTVKIWGAGSGECLQKLEGHRDWVNSVAFSHDSAQLASASVDRTVKIWDAGSGECLQTLEGHRGSVNSVAFSHDSAWLASASNDRTVKNWDAGSGKCLQTLEGHRDWVRSVAFSHDSARLASASDDSTVKIWDAGRGECLQTLEGHSSWVWSVAFSHDSARLASTSVDSTVKIWGAGSGECLQKLEGHRDWVRSVAFSHDSAWLVSTSVDKTVKIWDAGTGECLQTLEGHSSWVNSVAFSHDSARLASASDDRTVKIWDAGSGECLQTLIIGQTLFRISFDTNSYFQTDIGTIEISALSSPRPLLSHSEPQSPQYQGLALSADGVWITYNSENLIWLPSEYRPSCSVVSKKMIGAGVKTGRARTVISRLLPIFYYS